MDAELMHAIKRAEEFHGHLGPFLVIGVRMGLIGVRKLGLKENSEKLRVTATLRNQVPFSCVVDGIQVTTKCTIGNRKLKLIDSQGIAAEFELPHRKKITVKINPTVFDRFKSSLLSENVLPEETEKLALMVASMPEEELFIIGRK